MAKRRSKKPSKSWQQLRKEKWDALKKQPQEAINHEILLTLLNAMFMGSKRKQNVATVYLATRERDSIVGNPLGWTGKEVEAFKKASIFLNTLGYVLEAGSEIETCKKTGREFVSYVARVSGLQEIDPAPVRRMYWQGRKYKQAREDMGVIPVLRKRNQAN